LIDKQFKIVVLRKSVSCRRIVIGLKCPEKSTRTKSDINRQMEIIYNNNL
jgi:hypothetical protein